MTGEKLYQGDYLMDFLNDNDGCPLMTIVAASIQKRCKSENTIGKKLKIGYRVALAKIKMFLKIAQKCWEF